MSNTTMYYAPAPADQHSTVGLRIVGVFVILAASLIGSLPPVLPVAAAALKENRPLRSILRAGD